MFSHRQDADINRRIGTTTMFDPKLNRELATSSTRPYEQ